MNDSRSNGSREHRPRLNSNQGRWSWYLLSKALKIRQFHVLLEILEIPEEFSKALKIR
jgi:hypothetical protein